jgi:hypothetical protein
VNEMILFIETRFFDSGKVGIRRTEVKSERIEEHKEYYDYYCDEINANKISVQDWLLDNMEIEVPDTFSLCESLKKGEWVDITKFV